MSLIIPNFKDRNTKILSDLPEVVLAQMMQDAGEPVKLAFLQQSYTLNRDLQATGLQNVPYWNAFDDLQQVKERDGLPLTIYDFSLPNGVEPFFNNSGNQVLLYQNHQLKMDIQVHNQIEVEKITHFLSNGNLQVDDYDDRGFLSTSTWFTKDHQLIKKKWFTPFQKTVAEMNSNQEIIIQPQFRTVFWQKSYHDINQLAAELYEHHFNRPSVVIAAFRAGADQQNRFYLQLPAVQKIALLDQDISLTRVKNVFATKQKVTWIFPSRILEKQFLKAEAGQEQGKLNTTVIEPYPTNFKLGASNELETQMVYWQFRQQTNEMIKASLMNIFPLILKNEKLLFLLDAPILQRELIDSLAKQWIKKTTMIDPNSNDYQRYFEADDYQSFNSEAEWLDYLDEHLEDESEELDKEQLHQFYVVGNFLARVQLVTEDDDINEVFGKIRIFVDQGLQADLRKQILAISSGVPILSFAPTDLINPAGNGFQKTTIASLTDQLNYFLSDLHHWNQGLVDSVILMEKYEPSQILRRWKVVMTDD